MGIGMIGQYGMTTGSYLTKNIPVVTPDEVIRQDREREALEAGESIALSQQKPEAEQNRPQQNTPVEEVSLTFNKQENFDYLGSESDIMDLDMRKAISDMQKDQVLRQYQYFVGSSQNLVLQNTDGLVIAK